MTGISPLARAGGSRKSIVFEQADLSVMARGLGQIMHRDSVDLRQTIYVILRLIVG